MCDRARFNFYSDLIRGSDPGYNIQIHTLRDISKKYGREAGIIYAKSMYWRWKSRKNIRFTQECINRIIEFADKELIMKFAEFIEVYPDSRMQDFAFVLHKKNTDNAHNALDVVEKYSEENRNGVMETIARTAKRLNTPSFDAAINTLNLYVDEMLIVQKLYDVAVYNANKEFQYFNSILQKYRDNNIEAICAVFPREEKSTNALDELLEDRTYNAIKNTDDPEKLVQLIVTPLYAEVACNLVEVQDVISYKEIKDVMKTYKFVIDVHKYRIESDLQKIKLGFLTEMRRAFLQSSDVDEQIDLIKQYCREVDVKLKDNAAELMVCH